MLADQVQHRLAKAARATKLKRQTIRLDGNRKQMSFLQFLRKKAIGEAMTDSDLITAFSCEIPADAELDEVVEAAEATKDQIIAAHKLGGRVTLTAVVLGQARLLDN